ncbi:MAG: hypothetical protein JXA13_12165 [Anaerolineales bacterium]|nr:hypothetical protein [Anaerolineales bacterium]
MFFVLFVLHNPDLLEDLLAAWEEIGVQGVTILPSTGLGRIRQRGGPRDDLPIMPSLNDFYNVLGEEFNRTLFTVIKDEGLIARIVAATEEVAGSLNEPETGMLVVLPTHCVVGLRSKLGDEK